MPNTITPMARGLRERKKLKTRESIQREAMRLFQMQGYEETTIEQIAAAVEISPSTFFNYFPNKEDVVLYDALDLPSMDPATRRRANHWLVVISALYGALRPTDRIPPYRLSMGVNLGELGPLASVWRAPLASVLPLAARRGLIVDCRSSTYAAAWLPRGDLATRWVQVSVPGATHMAKHTRGLVARHVCEGGADARTVKALQRVVDQRFDTTLTVPVRPGQPWILKARVR